MNSLISISVPTEAGIDIYSSKIINDTVFYIQTLRESGITIDIEYTDRKEQFGIETLVGLFLIDDLGDSISNFNELYNGEFNSTRFKIFDMIEKSYFDKYGFSIQDGPVFQKYHELHRKIAITEKSLTEMWRKFDAPSRSKIVQLRLEYVMDECNKFVIDPYQNEGIIIEKLESILKAYKKVMAYQSTVGAGVIDNEPKREMDIESKKAMTIKKNKYGQFVYDKYNFVFDPKNKCITGVSNGIGGVNPLTEENIRLCMKIGINYKRS
ncbi:MAG: hypothetical protein PHG66_00610 [Candidatus Colwellbacteria bacterium]|nr:hypothetical protein [Candidatus Colwellbacteria bacterium]